MTAAVVCVAACSSGGPTSSGPTSASVGSPTSTTATPRTTGPTPLTAGQLGAHLGVGVPRGWVPVDMGDARVWTPPNLAVETEGGADECGADTPALPVDGIVGLGTTNLCPRHPRFEPRQTVSILSSAGSPAGPPDRTVHGYRIYRVAPTTRTSSTYAAPQLGVTIALQGPLSNRILDTLAPSSRTVVVAFATQPIPRTYRTVHSDGVTLSIPPQWAVTPPTKLFAWCYWPTAADGRPELATFRPRFVSGGCGAFLDYTSILPADGVILYATTYLAGSRLAPPRGQQPLSVLHHGATTITVYAGSSAMARTSSLSPSLPFLDTVDVFVRRAASSVVHRLTLGLGRDGRTAAAVLASIGADA